MDYSWYPSGQGRASACAFRDKLAEVAMLVHELGGPRWSFTVHGPEEFDKPKFIALPEKIRRSKTIVAVSSFGRSQLFRNVSHEHWPNIRVVHCGIEVAFYGNAVDQPPGNRRLICVGRLSEQKGQLLLVDAARQLRDRGTKFELVLAGDGDMRPELEATDRAARPSERGADHRVDSQRSGPRRNPRGAGAGVAELRGRIACRPYGGDGLETSGHQHVRRRHPGTGGSGRTRLVGSGRRCRGVGGCHAGLPWMRIPDTIARMGEVPLGHR